MTGGAVGSILAQSLHLTADERKTLLVSGAAAGMAATFNAPLAAVLLAVELLLFEWRPRSFVPVVAAVAAGTLLRGPLLGTAPVFPMPLHDLHMTAWPQILCVAAGAVGGLLAVAATGLVYASEDLFARLPLHWMWWPALGGVIIGLGGLVEPHALGVGYDVIRAELTGTATLRLVVGILVVKTVIWSLSLGSGTSGGVLAPVFMIGGALGALESHLFPPVSPGFWSLVALAGVVGGVMRSPFTGVVFALELTGEYDALLPLVIGASTAYALSVVLLKRSVLTEKIARRGYHLSREYDVDPLEVLFVGEVMSSDVVQIGEQVTVDEALAVIGSGADNGTGWRQRLYPVVTDDGTLTGVVTRHALLSAAALTNGHARMTDLCRPALAVTHQDQTLRHAAELMAAAEVNRVPVIDRDRPDRIAGVVSLTQLLAARQRDQQEARERARVLRPRVVRTVLLGTRSAPLAQARRPVG
jgi:CBS domain-containing protein